MDAAEMGYLIGIILGSLLAGTIFGLIPFILGRKRGLTGLGTAGLICTIVGYFIWPLIGGIVAAVFIIIIMIKSR